jgi:nitrogen fixation-related uncharacterized protein
VNTANEVILTVVAVATVLVVLGLFVWAAIKDGQEDKALQKRLRIRRRTRLGRKRLTPLLLRPTRSRSGELAIDSGGQGVRAGGRNEARCAG